MNPLPVAGIGASAGGIEAFRRFFENMPPDTGLGFVVVLHLPPERKSMLPEIIARWTTMQVREAGQGETIEPDTVHVIPPGVVATLRDGRLTLRQVTTEVPRATAPIDVFFDSMATALNEDAIGIILSGTGHDGALGLKAIKTRGGLTLAQGTDGSSPEHHGMPDSAVAAGAVDLLVPVEQMPTHILTVFKARGAAAPGARQPASRLDKVRLEICEILRSRIGHDFSQYKNQTFMRRVQRRMQVLRLTRFNDYLEQLRNDRAQVILLFRDLLISVTSFFRDAAAFSVLERTIVPRLFEGKDANAHLRVWVPGCATGEEAYSLAILLREHMDRIQAAPKIQVFASDIDESAIATARAGRYPASLLEGMEPERLSRFFAEGTGGYTVRAEVRDLCTFSTHSLIRDPPFSRIDMISCRNLLIYLDTDLQDRVIPTFHYALQTGGILLLGISETIARHERLFAPLDRLNRIFLRQPGPSEAPSLAYTPDRTFWSGRGPVLRGSPEPKSISTSTVNLANRRILERFASAFVVVTANGDIVHYSSHTGRFLEPALGTPTANLFDMARPVWRLDLRRLLRDCIESGRPVEQEQRVLATPSGSAVAVRLVAEPLAVRDADPLYMVIFVEAEPTRPGAASASPAAPEREALVAQLERENRDLREQLQSVAEEHSTAIEELRSANEELQSVNEEAQSSNEELETSKEEIQSVNEELHTVNVQLTTKVEELDRANSDLRNLFESTKVATVFLDPFLVIRSFTPEIASIYNLIPNDHGRPLTDIVSRLNYATLREDVQHVLHTLEPLEKRVDRADGTIHYLMRILPYRASDNTIDGSLITFVDVTGIVRAEAHQRLLVDELNHRVKNMLTVVISLASNTIRRASTLPQFSEVFLGRIHALTSAYTLLSREGWSAVSLREILADQLRPFMSEEHRNVELSGPDVLLEPRAALALGIAAHELTTNAVKYGALSVSEGTVAATWSIKHGSQGQYLLLKWTERRGPPVSAPDRRGFGTTLIERGLTHDLSGEVTLDFAPAGLQATIQAPLRGPAGVNHEGDARQ